MQKQRPVHTHVNVKYVALTKFEKLYFFAVESTLDSPSVY